MPSKSENPRVKAGDNSGDDEDDFLDTSPEKIDRAVEKRLVQYFERIERLVEEKKAIADDIKDVFAEAKSDGYDTKTMRYVLRLRAMESHDRQEMEALIETYKAAVGLD